MVPIGTPARPWILLVPAVVVETDLAKSNVPAAPEPIRYVPVRPAGHAAPAQVVLTCTAFDHSYVTVAVDVEFWLFTGVNGEPPIDRLYATLETPSIGDVEVAVAAVVAAVKATFVVGRTYPAVAERNAAEKPVLAFAIVTNALAGTPGHTAVPAAAV